MQVRRRLVIYVQGYDPRGLAEYFRMFRREYRRTCELYGVTGRFGPVEQSPQHFADWHITTSGQDWTVETDYRFLRWEDIIRKDFEQPAWWKVVSMIYAMCGTIFSGAYVRIFRAHWRFGLFVIYPLLLTIAWALLGAGVGIVCAALLARFGMPAAIADVIGLVVAAGVFAAAIRLTESKTYLLYMCDDIFATYQFAHGRRPDWEARMDTFAGYVIDTLRDSKADEAIIVGHSSGSFLAVDVLDRALQREPVLGRQGPRLRLLTLGANLPIIGFHRSARWFRERLQRLVVAADIDWVDYQSRHDIMNFWPFDPATGHGIRTGQRRNPLVVAISFRDLWTPGDFGRRRWRFFKAHFQFLMANERLAAAYDYYLICCGPLDLLTRATKPQDAIAAMAGQHGH